MLTSSEERFLRFLLEDDEEEVGLILRKVCLELKMEGIEKLIEVTLDEIGAGWIEGKYSLAQVYLTAGLVESATTDLIHEQKINFKKDVSIGICVFMDHHSLGKQIVSTILRVNGYKVMDYGDGLNFENVCRILDEIKPEVLLISSLMLPATLRIKEIVDYKRSKGYSTKIVIGGAPVRLDPQLIEKVGADAGANHASEIISILKKLGVNR